ncbi:hypothetical protein DIURU_001437 [Diutina rugosa]|uniref:Uncharacterized protein n=1 Tax=Diutina rugosa TaxID=5481 RepID=A0A642UUR6_DIURU|nr:uncharacterized protein DIURU_001437 [Diutina rugosa]KAA8905634.1 hypothetical protein DIURU_001437 [Diutina rugosa]
MQTSFPLERVPRLRRLKLQNLDIFNVSIDAHLEYVELNHIHLRNLLISANEVNVVQFDLLDQSFAATELNENYTRQQLTCDRDIKMPKAMDSLIISTEVPWNGAYIERRDDLKSLCIEFASSLEITVPKNLEKLRIIDAEDPAVVHFVDTAKLEYIEFFKRELIPQYNDDEDVTPPAFIPDGFVQVGLMVSPRHFAIVEAFLMISATAKMYQRPVIRDTFPEIKND